jgi:uncharacterized membrane protein YeiB
MNSIELNQRIDELDYLRGFALLGIILVNILHMLEIKVPASHTLDAAYWRFLYLFVEGRFYTIFTFLFGIGFYIFMTRANQKGKNGTFFFLRRMLALLVIGLVHMQFQPGEALTINAICGLIILPFYKASKVVNLIFGIAILLVLSIFSIKIFMTVPMMLLGIAAGQFQLFNGISQQRKKLRIFTVTMFFLSICGLILQYQYAPQVLGKGMQRFLRIGIAIGPIVSAFYVGMMIFLLKIPFFQKLFSPLKNYGRMALTNYVSQTALILTAGHMLHLFGKITYIQSLFLCFAIYAIQLAFSAVWLRYFRFGPLEWIWRIVTYFEIPPLRR